MRPKREPVASKEWDFRISRPNRQTMRLRYCSEEEWNMAPKTHRFSYMGTFIISDSCSLCPGCKDDA